MAHLHNITDADHSFYIDPITRVVKNNSGKVTLAQKDHNSERFTFEIPRYVDGHDMSLCDKVEIHFVNRSTGGTEMSEDIYTASDVHVAPASIDKVSFSWLISDVATKYAGTVQFLVRFVCMEGDKPTYVWSTAIFKGITVIEGM